MGDVADILGLRDGPNALRGGAASGARKTADKKPDGMSREVFALLGSSSALPSLYPSIGRMADIRARKEPVKPWLWSEFEQSARADGLKLKHWQRKANVGVGDYAFARFNKKCAVVRYSPEEYALHVAPNDGAEWNKSDTDILFRLCDDLDLRWHLIEDRWPSPLQPSVTSLKWRYYEVAKTILQARRNKTSKKANKQQRQSSVVDMVVDGGVDQGGEVGAGNSSLLANGKPVPRTATVSGKATMLAESAILEYTYNREYEEKRMAQMKLLYSRNPEEEKDENQLVQEIRKIDAHLKRLQREAPVVKRPKAGSKPEPPTLQAFPPSMVEQVLTGESLRSKHVLKNEPSVSVRSARLYPISDKQIMGIGPRLEQKVSDLLLEIGMPYRPVPTARVCNAFDKLRQDAVKLLALQSKLFDAKTELAELKGLPLPVRPGGGTGLSKPKKRQQVRAAALTAAAAQTARQQGQGQQGQMGAGSSSAASAGGGGSASTRPASKKKKSAPQGEGKPVLKKVKLKLKGAPVVAAPPGALAAPGGGGAGPSKAAAAAAAAAGSSKRKASDKGASSSTGGRKKQKS